MGSSSLLVIVPVVIAVLTVYGCYSHRVQISNADVLGGAAHIREPDTTDASNDDAIECNKCVEGYSEHDSIMDVVRGSTQTGREEARQMIENMFVFAQAKCSGVCSSAYISKGKQTYMMQMDKIVDKTYVKIDSGKCSDTGAFPILNKAACEAAAVSLGLSGTVATQSDSTPRPEGCYYNQDVALCLGTNRKNQGLGSDALRKQVCETRPQVDEKEVQVEGEKKAMTRRQRVTQAFESVPADNDVKAEEAGWGARWIFLAGLSAALLLFAASVGAGWLMDRQGWM